MSLEQNILKLYIIKAAKWFMLIMPVYALYYEENGLAGYDLLLLQSVYSFSLAIMEIPSGYFADVIGRKITIVIGSILGTVGFAIYSLTTGFWPFLIAELILGVGQSFISGADSAMLFDSLDAIEKRNKYLKFEGRITAFGSFAETIAAVVGGIVIAKLFSVRAVFVFQTFVALIAVPASLMLIEPPRKKMSVTPSLKHIFNVSYESLFVNRKLSSAILFSSVIGSATLCMAWVTLVFLTSVHHLSEVQITPVWVILNLIVAVVSFFAAKISHSFGIFRSVVFIALFIPFGYLALSFNGFYISLILLGGFYFVRGIATPLLKDLINVNCSSDVRATVLSVRSLLIRLIFASFSPLLVLLCDKNGFSSGIQMFSLPLFVLSCLTCFYLVRTHSYKKGNKILQGSN